MDAGGPQQQQLSPAEEQEKWLQDAFKAVKQAAFYMRRALVRARLPRAQSPAPRRALWPAAATPARRRQRSPRAIVATLRARGALQRPRAHGRVTRRTRTTCARR